MSEELYKKAIDKWGKETQIIVMIEEMAELTQHLCKTNRKTNSRSWQDTVKEMVDVEIMLEQMKIVFCVNDDFFEIEKQRKLKRLKELIENVIK